MNTRSLYCLSENCLSFCTLTTMTAVYVFCRSVG